MLHVKKERHNLLKRKEERKMVIVRRERKNKRKMLAVKDERTKNAKKKEYFSC